MFVGRFAHNMDKKGRITIPSSFRDVCPKHVVIMRGLDNNIMGMTKQAFDNLSAETDKLSITNKNLRHFKRLVIGQATLPLEYDDAGRILIPPHLRKAAGIETAVMIVGSGSYFEIWSAEKLEALEAETVIGEEEIDYSGLDIIINNRGN